MSQELLDRIEALLRGNAALREYAAEKENFAWQATARAEAAEAWRRRHMPAVTAAYAILDAARPLILNGERLKDAGEPPKV